ncbi:hypothetical protein GUA87_11330 [Sneathiella sp. P13V-1]|uniref:VPLPA-CTERM sorting domain-containing protein n=1 Tax=Sneathiella sp. P13V-1 TaxID=2697366 RepID=UPI00187B7C88|nr:VPLPA-CTERM sorting domain-containing protein [Sneathiella sp. P13V-1]MBE7637438.1 hypothetical protein [Sneathiella sp. P13V-1]
MKIRLRRVWFALSALLAPIVASTTVNAASLNLVETPPLGYNNQSNLSITGATFTSNSGYHLYTGFPGDGNNGTICAGGSLDCLGDLWVNFDAPVKNVSIDFLGYDQGDEVFVTLFDLNNNPLSSIGVTGNGTVQFVGPFEVSRIFLNNDSNTNLPLNPRGMLYQNFKFDLVTPDVISSVPLPAGLPLFAAGIAIAGFLVRRKRK